jgi:hypothetical protein
VGYTWRQALREDFFHFFMTLSEDTVPSNLEEALEMLVSGASPDDIEVIKSHSAEHLSSMVHFGFGMALRNNWSLWEKDTPLVNWFKGIGITHPDDMSGIINTSFCRRVRGEDIALDEQVKGYQAYWLKSIGKPIP